MSLDFYTATFFKALPACSLALLLSASANAEAAGDGPVESSSPKPTTTVTAPLPTGAEAPREEKPVEPEEQEFSWSALPVGTYAPETELGVGAFGAVMFRIGDAGEDARASAIAGVALVTTLGQAIFELISELYWDDDDFRIWTKLDYRYYPNRFWGVGSRTPDNQEELYTENGPRFQFFFRRNVFRKLYLELRLDAQFSKVEDLRPGGILDSGDVVGAHSRRAIGLGPTVGWDSRDHSLEPHEGGFHEVSLLQFHEGLGSDQTFTRLELNLRQYFNLAEGHTLATQLYGAFAYGNVPFYRLPLAGGQNVLRGYFEGRYRDRALIAAQVEYRAHLFWRFGGVLFAAAGDVGPSLSEIRFSPLKWSVGGGLRLQLNEDERFNLRADLGVGYQTYGIYVGIAEAF